jgi:hypothetical protein
MGRTNRVPKAILLLVVTVAIGYGFYSSIEFYDEKVAAKWSPEARRNPYLAAQLFMQRSGVEIGRAVGLFNLESLNEISTLLITESMQVISPRQLDRLTTWLDKGGNLIVAAASMSDSDSLLLQKFNVGLSRPEHGHDEDERSDDTKSISEALRQYNQQIDEGKTPEEIGARFADKLRQQVTKIEFEGEVGDLEIVFEINPVLTHPGIDGSDGGDKTEPRPFSWSASKFGFHMMQFKVGSGQLTIVSDPGIWRSGRIDQLDHAYLLWVLSSDKGDFAILQPTRQDSIWVLMRRYAPELLTAIGAVVLAWLWHLGRRFGRVVPHNTTQNRALSEHFSATANYLWHRRAGDFLIAPLLQQIVRRASLTLPGFAEADTERQQQLIGAHCGIDSATIGAAMTAQDFNEASFVRTVKLLKHIEQSL